MFLFNGCILLRVDADHQVGVLNDPWVSKEVLEGHKMLFKLFCTDGPHEEAEHNTNGIKPHTNPIRTITHTQHLQVCHTPWLMRLVSPTQPQRDILTSMGSVVESDRYSVPLSMAPLPTDWGDWVPELDPWSAPERDVASVSLEERADFTFLTNSTLFMTQKLV